MLECMPTCLSVPIVIVYSVHALEERKLAYS